MFVHLSLELRLTVHDEPWTWANQLADEFSSGFSPNQFVFGKDVSLPSELETDRSAEEPGLTYNEGARRAAEVRPAAEKAHAEAGAKAALDRAQRHPMPVFEDERKAGDMVFFLQSSS